MEKGRKSISLEEAINEVEVAMTRVALLHLAFSRTLILELGKEKGKESIIKAMLEYGQLISEHVSTGGKDLPSFGVSKDVHADDDGNVIVKDCVLARIFKRYGEPDLGRLYCYVDAAKSMATDPSRKLVHVTSEACGDDRCTFAVLLTTEKERNDFINRHVDWKNVDPRLTRE